VRRGGRDIAGATDAAIVRAPRQARSQETLERLLGATLELLDECSFDEITVADIVRQAERTVGSFYARFEDKYAVLYELVARRNERIVESVTTFCEPDRWTGRPLAEFVAESVTANVRAVRRSTPLFRAALIAAATDERFREQRHAMTRECAELQKAFVMTRIHEISCVDPARASDQMFEVVAAALEQELLFGGPTATWPADDNVLAGELIDRCAQIYGID